MTTPRTVAGRRHVSALVGLLGGEDWWTTSVLAIEAEARAAALDEARDDADDEAERRIAAAIDALRERSDRTWASGYAAGRAAAIRAEPGGLDADIIAAAIRNVSPWKECGHAWGIAIAAEYERLAEDAPRKEDQ